MLMSHELDLCLNMLVQLTTIFDEWRISYVGPLVRISRIILWGVLFLCGRISYERN